MLASVEVRPAQSGDPLDQLTFFLDARMVALVQFFQGAFTPGLAVLLGQRGAY